MKKYKLIIVVILLLIGAIGSYKVYNAFYSKIEGNETTYLIKIDSKNGYRGVLDSIFNCSCIPDTAGFKILADLKSYPSLYKTGLFKIRSGATQMEVINQLRIGKQAEFDLVLNNVNDYAHLSRKLGESLMYDSSHFASYFIDLDEELKYNLIPNTYRVYWNSSADIIYQRFRKESKRFWNQERIAKAKAIGLTEKEVSTLASIVQKESSRIDERPIIAGLYLNRLEKGLKLQSDPTVIYSIHQEFPDRKIQRVYYKDLEYESDYNTYLNKGLPPSPICIPDISAIEAVLNAQDHNYIFMVANPDRPGYHSFASSLAGHNRNKKKYISWMRANNIR